MMQKRKPRKSEILLSYLPLIEQPPVSNEAMYRQSCQNDGITIESWRETWCSQVQENWDRFGPFHESGLGEYWGHMAARPCVVAGSGPSLKRNAHLLANRGNIGLISALHNFHFFEDLGVKPDFYVSLDAGPVVIEEVAEGGSLSEDEYWERTKDHTMLCFIGSPPQLIEKWQGKVVWFNCAVPDEKYRKTVEPMEFNTFVGTGGNVAGACMYIAKAIMGANPIAYVGMDLSFSLYDCDKPMFHGWDSKYDKNLGHTIDAVDVYGNKTKTWASYANFTNWFHYVATKVPGFYINCTEGGILGSVNHGILRDLPAMDLSEFLEMYRVHEHTEQQCRNPKTSELKLVF